MARKVIQFKARCGWNRAASEDLTMFMRRLCPAWPDGHLREAARYLLSNGKDLGVKIRFDRLNRCREESYKGFTGTERYFREIEYEGMFI